MTLSSPGAPPALPSATYRLQLNLQFPFRAAAALVDYLHALGISHCYTSPVLVARSGSRHGYDGVDPTRLNPELGGDGDFRIWQEALRSAGLGLLLDIVPNHLCVVGGENPWWQDVLTHGRGSPHAVCFDIDWSPPDPALHGRVLLPLLGAPLPEVLAQGELRVAWAQGALHLTYFDHRWPLAPASWPLLLASLRDRLPALRQAALRGTLHGLLRDLRGFRAPAAATRVLGPSRRAAFRAVRERLALLLGEDAAFREAFLGALAAFNAQARAGLAGPWGTLLEGQAWCLDDWREAGRHLNYRRFFDITELAGLRQEHPRVFAATHERVLALVEQGAVQGLRIDHPDGLADPTGYLRRLRRALHGAIARAHGRGHGHSARAGTAGMAGYVVVEKILEPSERRRGNWPVEGGTGYDMLYRLNAVQVDRRNAPAFRAAYARCTGDAEPFIEHVRECKRLVLRTALAGDLERLALLLAPLARSAEALRTLGALPVEALRAALEALLISLPVYRTYVAGGGPASAEDRHWITAGMAEARRRHGELEPALLEWVGALLLHPARALHAAGRGASAARAAQDFTTRFQQLSSAAMAKGVEDTAFYRYVPLISLNEVGGDPGTFGIDRAEFHTWNARRARRWPHALSATATHDTKRGEGARAIINVLSEIPAEWEAACLRWQGLNARHRSALPGGPAPDAGTEYLFYQTLVGAWPLGGRADGEWAGFPERIAAYLHKVVREAKRRTSWLAPDADYEGAVQRFAAAVLAEGAGNPFPADLERFLAPLVPAGLHNALSQTLLKLALPGVPDFYQGTELWEQSLVDPDNRRAVDFQRRRALLASLPTEPTPAAVAGLLAAPRDGRIKLHVIRAGLGLRRRRQKLFAGSDYRPLHPGGSHQRHVIGFARTRGAASVVAAVGRFYLGLPGAREALPAQSALPVGAAVWGDTVLEGERGLHGLPGGTYRNVLSGETLTPARTGGRLVFPLSELFATLPVALLERMP